MWSCHVAVAGCETWAFALVWTWHGEVLEVLSSSDLQSRLASSYLLPSIPLSCHQVFHPVSSPLSSTSCSFSSPLMTSPFQPSPFMPLDPP